MNIVGITNGPIFDTVQEASTPVALWFASTFFSEYTCRLCAAIRKEIPDAIILSPYFSEQDDLSDGVGKYHDRIIFKSALPASKLASSMSRIIADTKSGMIGLFLDQNAERNYRNGFPESDMESGKRFLEEYLYSEFAIQESSQEAKNSILAISDKLDDLELMRDFPASDSGNPFHTLFAGEEGARNQYLKSSKLFKMITLVPNPLKRQDDQIISIENIAAGAAYSSGNGARDTEETKLKKYSYYAVVSADGDGMGKYLEKVDDDHVTGFSKCCFNYAVKASKLIRSFGGMPIYIGGDDLLFLAPLENTINKKEGGETGEEITSLFQLCGRINETFQNELKSDKDLNSQEELKDVQIPTISFGISIQYVKYPLYEALQESRSLLNDVVKGNKNTRNSMAIRLVKHSGQSICLRVSNKDVDRLQWYLDPSIAYGNPSEEKLKKGNDIEKNETNVIRQLLQYEEVLGHLNKMAISTEHQIGRTEYLAAWKNFFDNPNQLAYQKYLTELGGRFYDDFLQHDAQKADIEIPKAYRKFYTDRDYSETENYVQILISILRLRKFYMEKAGEEE